MNIAECIVRNTVAPDPRLADSWNAIVCSPELKDRLLHAALLALELRPKLKPEVTALHGLILLHGPPGTGKTTLARGLAQEVAGLTPGRRVRLIEVNPHGLMSAEHGQSQKRVYELLAEHIPSLADPGDPTIVLLDEVESMAVARSAASLQANPADVHRATDAVLTALDALAREHPSIIVIATSNFTDALDDAFKSRADVSIEVPLPNQQAITAILQQALTEFGDAYPKLSLLAGDPALPGVARRLIGADGRRVRKIISEALGRRIDTVIDPNLLTIADLLTAVTGLTGTQDQVEQRHAAA